MVSLARLQHATDTRVEPVVVRDRKEGGKSGASFVFNILQYCSRVSLGIKVCKI